MLEHACHIAAAHGALVDGKVELLIEESNKAFLLTRSVDHTFHYSQQIACPTGFVKSLLPPAHCVLELMLVIDGSKQKGSGCYGFSDIFVLSETGENNVCLELKYIPLAGLMGNKKNIYTSVLDKLDKDIEKEDKSILLNKEYTYWSK